MSRLAKVSTIIGIAAAVSLTGCASIVSKSSWPVTVQSNPQGAKCVVAKENGVQLHTGETPMIVTLNSGDGFFQRAKYSITCEKEGYQKAKLETNSSFNGWYLGNVVFGGLIGILIVDPATGAMYRMDETAIVNLYADTAEGRMKQSDDFNKQGYELYTKKDYETAIGFFDKALEAKADNHQSLCNKGLCLSKLGQYDEAMGVLNKVVSAKPDFADAYKTRGDIFRMKGDKQKALADFDTALKLKPLYTEALFSRAELYIGENKKEEAKADLALACKQGYDRACHFQF